MNIGTWILVGGLLGWAASLLTGTNVRQAMILKIGVGIAGVVLGGFFLNGLLGSSPFNQGEFSREVLLVSMLGAMVLLAAVQLLTASLEERAEPPKAVT
jgi:uncharacterized membrane protein YeaQ/YmgE (transglycosylase-associated protein family)